MDEITFCHSFKAGDLLSLLPSVKNICKRENKKAIIYQELGFHAFSDHNVPDADTNTFSQAMFDAMKPLLMYQDYIEDFRVWKGEECRYNINITRINSQVPMPGGNMFYYPMMIFPKLEPTFERAWINHHIAGVIGYDDINTKPDEYPVSDYFLDRPIAINRTPRYQSPYMNYYWLKEYQDKCVFVGIKSEYEEFCNRWSLEMPLYTAKDFLDLAAFYWHKKLTICNQSVSAHLIIGGKKKPYVEYRHLLEISPQFPNLWPNREEIKPFILEPQAKVLFENAIKDLNL